MRDTVQTQPAGFSGAGVFENVRLAHQRRMREAFIDFMGNADKASVLEMNLLSASGESAGVDLQDALAPSHARISACMLAGGDARPWRCSDAAKELFPAHRLPYEDASVDWVYCDGIIERIGGYEEQAALVREMWRVARKGIFVTAQNKRHPVDFGSGLPFMHWLSSGSREGVNEASGYKAGTRHLLDARTLDKMASALPENLSHAVGHVRYLGIKAHFFLMASKKK